MNLCSAIDKHSNSVSETNRVWQRKTARYRHDEGSSRRVQSKHRQVYWASSLHRPIPSALPTDHSADSTFTVHNQHCNVHLHMSVWPSTLDNRKILVLINTVVQCQYLQNTSWFYKKTAMDRNKSGISTAQTISLANVRKETTISRYAQTTTSELLCTFKTSLWRYDIAPKFSHTTPILWSLQWLLSALNTSFSHLPTKFSQPPNIHICITSSQFSLLAALAFHLWSHSLTHPHHLLYE